MELDACLRGLHVQAALAACCSGAHVTFVAGMQHCCVGAQYCCRALQECATKCVLACRRTLP